jgi:RHS repeat-associated protein
VRVVTDAAGALISKHLYMPFGEESPFADQKSTSTRQFTGHERDSDNGSDYMLARYFNIHNGRFDSPDPLLTPSKTLGSPQAWNRYSYVLNNPMNHFDPDGTTVWLSDDPKERAIQINYWRRTLGSSGRYLVGVGQGGHWALGVSGTWMASFARLGTTEHALAIAISAPQGYQMALGHNELTVKGGGSWCDCSSKGGTIYLDPDAFPNMHGNVEQTVESALAHELGHLISNLMPRTGIQGGRMNTILNEGEWSGMSLENAWRWQSRVRLREYYERPGDYSHPAGFDYDHMLAPGAGLYWPTVNP